MAHETIYVVTDFELNGKETEALEKFFLEKKGAKPTSRIIKNRADAQFTATVVCRADTVVVCSKDVSTFNEASKELAHQFETINMFLNFASGEFEQVERPYVF